MGKKETNGTQDVAFSEILRDMQVKMSLTPMWGPQIKAFWDTQDKLASDTQNFAAHWFTRRSDALRSGLDTARTITTSDKPDPMSAMALMMDWQKRATTRMIDDASDWFKLYSSCSDHAAEFGASAVGQSLELAQKVSQSSKSEPV